MANRDYRALLLAQVIALLGTGLATVALGLLAFDLAGVGAGAVLGSLLAIKMVANVVVAPIATALTSRLPRRALLVVLDLVRAGVAVSLPWVSQVWQIVVLVVVLQIASAAFTPTYQATIPTVLPDEDDYTRALSLSRLAFDLEGLLSPVLAAALLSVVGFSWLFAGTAVGFLASAALILSTGFLGAAASSAERARDRTLRGMRLYLRTPRLRAQLGLNLAAAAAGALVLVDTVVFVRGDLAGTETDVAAALGFFGGGSMLAALALPRFLAKIPDRSAMLAAAAALAAGLGVFAVVYPLIPADARWPVLLTWWALLGIAYSLVLTPVGRLIRRSGHAGDWPPLFAAQFALSHAGWLLTYPVAGILASLASPATATAVLAALAAAGVLHGARTWPAEDPDTHEHTHHDLDTDHPHVTNAEPVAAGMRHTHHYVLDDQHPRWPDARSQRR